MERRYRNILHAFQTILKDEGGIFSGCLYKGLPPTVMVSGWSHDHKLSTVFK